MTDVSVNLKEFLWFQKYRPNKVKETILPDNIKTAFQGFVDQDRVPNLILNGSRGIGKTTVAIAMCEEVGADYLFINASEDSGIDTIRTTIRNFASSYSISQSQKVIILDEADGLSPNAQGALKSSIEEFSKSCSFIFTCNLLNKIIEPIQSRCSVIDFKIAPSEKPKLAGEFYKRCCQILKLEEVSFNKTVVAEVVTKHFPDFRRVLNELQRYSVGKVLDVGVLANLEDEKFAELISALKEKRFNDARKWVANNSDIDSDTLYRELYDKSADVCQPQSIPELVMIIADYAYKSAFVIDKEINTMACMTELMLKVNWK